MTYLSVTMPKRRKSIENEITEIDVPHPYKSIRTSLVDLNQRIEEVTQKMQKSGNDPYPLCLAYVYLVGYRDAITGRDPNLPK